MDYLDFDLLIEPSGDGYTARVFNSPGGQASSDFSTPFSDLEIENFLLRVGRSRRAVRRIESPEMASAKAFGEKLFNGVFAGDVRGCLRSSLDEASRQGNGLRVRLHLAKAPALADLPWEFLYNAGLNRFLGLSVSTPLVRYLDLPERVRPLAVTPPLRVLMMISSPTDYPQLDVERESEKMTQALGDLEVRGLVTVERLEGATLSELQRRLRQGEYHIFHFVGHGAFDAQAEDGILLLEDQEERGRRVSAQFLGTLLHDHRPLRLAVLNACEGARASSRDPYAGTAQSLVQQGIPAVIAMQFEVSDEAAICFTREFYAAIAIGYPVDAALAEARKAIFAEVSEIEWGTPVLYMRSPDGHIFDVEQISELDRKQLHISSLLLAARTAAQADDDAAAVEKLGQVLALEPKHADATARLHEIEKKRDLASLYGAARAMYDDRLWRESLDVLRRIQAIDRGYRDVEALIAAAEREVVKAADDEERRSRGEALRRAASGAVAREQWDEAIEHLRALVALDPDDQQSRGELIEARHQRDLATLYARGRAQFERRHWREALAELCQVRQRAIAYKDVPILIATIERELDQAPAARQSDAAGLRSDAVKEPSARIPIAPPSPTTKPAEAREGAKRLHRGALGALVIVGAMIVGGIVLAIALRRSNEPSANPEETLAAPAASPEDTLAAFPPSPGESLAAPLANPAEMVAASPALRAELTDVIRAANNAVIQAHRALDASVLQSVYKDPILQTYQADIAGLARAQHFRVYTLYDQRVESALVSRDGQRAEAKLVETWSLSLHNRAMPGQPCMSNYRPRRVFQTAFLQRAGNGWLIYDQKIDGDEGWTLEPANCP